MSVYRMAKEYRPKPRTAKPVVIQPDYELGGLTYDREGYLVTAGEQMELGVIFNNLSNQTVAVRPELSPAPGVETVRFNSGELTLEPGARKEFRFTVAFTQALSGEEYSTFLLADGNGNATPMAVAVKRSRKSEVTLPVTTAPGEWIPIGDWRPLAVSKADINAKFRLSWTPEFLRLEVSVRDPQHSCDYDANQAWRGDSIQFGLQARDGKTPPQRLKFYNFCAASCAAGDTVYRHEPENVFKESVRDQIKFRYRRNNADSVYELEIPAGEIGIEHFDAGGQFGFALVVNSGSPGSRNGYLTWGDGIGDGKFPALYNDLKLVK